MSKTIAIANHKGGVAKTTTTLNLGAALARKGNKVLLIDSDEQGNLSEFLGCYDDEAEQGTIVEVYTDGTLPIQQVTENLSLVSANLNLGYIESSLKDQGLEGYVRLRNALESVQEEFDYILIDCPPSVSGMVISNAIVASDAVLVPCVPERGSVKGIQGVVRLCQSVRLINDKVGIEGIVFTKVEERTAVHQLNFERVAETFPDLYVYSGMIRKNISVAESQEFEIDLFAHDDKAKASRDYDAFAQEFLQRQNVSANV